MASVFLIAVLLNQSELLSLLSVAAFRLYVCSYNPKSMMSTVKQQVYVYLCYILVITYMFSASVQAITTSYLTIQTVDLPDLNPVVFDCLTLQLSSYSISKSC